MKIAVCAVALLALIQVFLAFAISRMRWKYRLSVGMPSEIDHPLRRVSTAFTNCCEWHPVLMAMMLVLPMGAVPHFSIWLPAVVVATRCLHVVGLTTFPLNRANAFRFLGALGTYGCVVFYAGLLLYAFW